MCAALLCIICLRDMHTRRTHRGTVEGQRQHICILTLLLCEATEANRANRSGRLVFVCLPRKQVLRVLCKQPAQFEIKCCARMRGNLRRNIIHFLPVIQISLFFLCHYKFSVKIFHFI